jgi:hypothetical protein
MWVGPLQEVRKVSELNKSTTPNFAIGRYCP